MPSNLKSIKHFVVLMMENHSFDHLLGYSGISGTDSITGLPRTVDGLIEGQLYSQDFYDQANATRSTLALPISKNAPFVMPHDPGHEFTDVRNQMWGPFGGPDTQENIGFVYAYSKSVGLSLEEAKGIMSAFTPDQLPVITTLAKEFAVFDRWFSPLPGPTWPNRFFVHAATSGGLVASPDPSNFKGDVTTNYDRACLEGFDFNGGTIYQALEAQKYGWRVYHGDHLPQVSVIRGMMPRLLCADGFSHLDDFAKDVAAGDLPEYTFIEPNYGNTTNFTGGNSQHPVGDIRDGERLIKLIYETLRKSSMWPETALVIMYDEHGGFFDHVRPDQGLPTGDDTQLNGDPFTFGFDQLGIRVPVIVASPLIPRGMIDHQTRDHTSLLATIEGRFGLSNLTKRDRHAPSFDVLFSLAAPRSDCPMTLPVPPDAPDAAAPQPQVPRGDEPLDSVSKSFIHVAQAAEIALDPSRKPEIVARGKAITTKAQASKYIADVEKQVKAKRLSCQ
jgi:phospholipase C